MELYSRDRGVSQLIEGHAAAFVRIRRFIPSISRPPLALVKFGKTNTFAESVTSITPRKSGT